MKKYVNVYLLGDNPVVGTDDFLDINYYVETDKTVEEIVYESLVKAIVTDRLFDLRTVADKPWIRMQVSHNQGHQSIITRLNPFCVMEKQILSSTAMSDANAPAGYAHVRLPQYAFSMYKRDI